MSITRWSLLAEAIERREGILIKLVEIDLQTWNWQAN